MWPCSVGCRCEARSEGAEKCFVGVRTGEAVIATTAATTTAGTAAAGGGGGGQQQQQQQPTGSSFLGGSSIVGRSLLGERTVDEIDGLQLTMEPEDIAAELPPPAPSLMRQTTGGEVA